MPSLKCETYGCLRKTTPIGQVTPNESSSHNIHPFKHLTFNTSSCPPQAISPHGYPISENNEKLGIIFDIPTVTLAIISMWLLFITALHYSFSPPPFPWSPWSFPCDNCLSPIPPGLTVLWFLLPSHRESIYISVLPNSSLACKFHKNRNRLCLLFSPWLRI